MPAATQPVSSSIGSLFIYYVEEVSKSTEMENTLYNWVAWAPPAGERVDICNANGPVPFHTVVDFDLDDANSRWPRAVMNITFNIPTLKKINCTYDSDERGPGHLACVSVPSFPCKTFGPANSTSTALSTVKCSSGQGTMSDPHIDGTYLPKVQCDFPS